MGAGAEVELFDGCGRLARCHLMRLDRRWAELEVLETAESEPPGRRQLTIATAVAKGSRMDFLGPVHQVWSAFPVRPGSPPSSQDNVENLHANRYKYEEQAS